MAKDTFTYWDPDNIHVMIDLETLSLEPNAAIIQTGAQQFIITPAEPICEDGDKHRPLLPNFEESIAFEELETGFDYGDWDISKATLNWWGTQDGQVRNRVFGGSAGPGAAIYRMYDWCQLISGEDINRIVLWSNGADFDLPILQHTWEQYSTWPFHYQKKGCYRTLTGLFPGFRNAAVRPFGSEHVAIEDAKLQASVAGKTLASIANTSPLFMLE